jgi:tetratricopeptide (TPR) repeat protein
MPVSATSLNATLNGEIDALLEAGRLMEARELGYEALQAAREAAAESPSWRSVLVQALLDIGRVEHADDQLTIAENCFNEAIKICEEIGNEPALMGKVRTRLATMLDFAGRQDQAIETYEKAVTDLETAGDVLTAARLRNNLALSYKRQGRHALAEQHYLSSVEVMEAQLGRETEEVAALYNNIGGLYYAAGYAEQAKEVFQDALDVRLPLLGPDHPDVSQSTSNLAAVCFELGDYETAQQHYEKALSILEGHLHDPQEAASYEAVGMDYIALLNCIQEEGKANALEQRLRQALAAALA